MAANRQTFAAKAKEKVKTVIYTSCDCIAFVKQCFSAAGGSCKAIGTNDCWRNYMQSKGKTIDYNIQVGDVVFRWREESSKLPAKYHGDGFGDLYHIGVVTKVGGGYEICHSSNSKDNGKVDIFNSKVDLAAKWMYAGTLKGTAADATAPSPSPSRNLDEAISLLEQAINLLKKI